MCLLCCVLHIFGCPLELGLLAWLFIHKTVLVTMGSIGLGGISHILLCTVSVVGGVCSVGVAQLVWVAVVADGCLVCGWGLVLDAAGGFFSRACGCLCLPAVWEGGMSPGLWRRRMPGHPDSLHGLWPYKKQPWLDIHLAFWHFPSCKFDHAIWWFTGFGKKFEHLVSPGSGSTVNWESWTVCSFWSFVVHLFSHHSH